MKRFAPKTVPNTAEGKPDIKMIHESLMEIKKNFPKETSVVIVPLKETDYEILVSLMDSARVLEPTDPPIYFKNEQTGVDEPLKALFPKVVFGNLLEDS